MPRVSKIIGNVKKAPNAKELEKMEELGNLLNRKNAAAYLGISPHTLAAWSQKKDNNGLPIIKVGSSVRYKMEDLMDFVERNRRVIRID